MGTHCLYCDKQIGPVRQFRGQRFCGDIHRAEYYDYLRQRLNGGLEPETRGFLPPRAAAGGSDLRVPSGLILQLAAAAAPPQVGADRAAPIFTDPPAASRDPAIFAGSPPNPVVSIEPMRSLEELSHSVALQPEHQTLTCSGGVPSRVSTLRHTCREPDLPAASGYLLSAPLAEPGFTKLAPGAPPSDPAAIRSKESAFPASPESMHSDNPSAPPIGDGVRSAPPLPPDPAQPLLSLPLPAAPPAVSLSRAAATAEAARRSPPGNALRAAPLQVDPFPAVRAWIPPRPAAKAYRPHTAMGPARTSGWPLEFPWEPVRVRFGELLPMAVRAHHWASQFGRGARHSLPYVAALAAGLFLGGVFRNRSALLEGAGRVEVHLAREIPGSKTARQLPWIAAVREAIVNRSELSLDDDFRSGFNNWKGPNSQPVKHWSHHPDGYLHAGQLGLYRPSQGLTDYRFEFLTQIERKSVDWVVRARDASNYYAVKFEVIQSGPRPWMAMVRYPVINGHKGKRVVTPLDISIHPTIPYRVALEVKGNEFRTFVEGEQADFWTDDTLSTGGVGLFSEAGERARVYWVKIQRNTDVFGRMCAWLTRQTKLNQNS